MLEIPNKEPSKLVSSDKLKKSSPLSWKVLQATSKEESETDEL